MLKTRIIPTLLFKDHGLVKGKSFDSWRRVGTALPAIRVYNRRAVDELIFLDISATPEGRTVDIAEVDYLADECFMPLTVGGGVKTVSDFSALLRAGADKVCVNSAAVLNPGLVSDSSAHFGSQCVVVSIDTKKISDGKYEVVIESGKKSTGLDCVEWAKQVQQLGAGEILLTSIEKDGVMEGYDLELIKLVASQVNIPVIASGGAGNYEDLYQAIAYSGASAVAAASIFHFTEQTPLEAKQYLQKRNIHVRT